MTVIAARFLEGWLQPQTLQLVLPVGFLLTTVSARRWVGVFQPQIEHCPLEVWCTF